MHRRWRFGVPSGRKPPLVGGTGAFLTLLASISLGGNPVAAVERFEAERANETVVLLHGLARSARNMWVLEWRLEALGYRVCNVDYDSRAATFDEVLDAVYEAIQACGEELGTVHFVTHSMGGLVLRGLLDRHPLPSAGRAVMLAPPNAGSEIADWARDQDFFTAAMGPLAGHLGTRPEDLPQRLPPPGIPFGVIAGDYSINPFSSIWLREPHDGTVSVASTRLPGMTDHLVLPHTHTFIMNASDVADQVDAFLRQGRFDRGGAPLPR